MKNPPINSLKEVELHITLMFDELLGIERPASALKPRSNHRSPFSDKLRLITIIQQGLPVDIFNAIREVTPFDEEQWADFLNISTKSLQRYSADDSHVFKPLQSEMIIQLGELCFAGYQVFDSSEHFFIWIQDVSIALGGNRPLDLLGDSYGQALVMDELLRIDHGIFV